MSTGGIIKELLATPHEVVQAQGVNQQGFEQFIQEVKTQETRSAAILKALIELNEILAEIKKTTPPENSPIFLTLKERKENFYNVLTNKQNHEAI